MYNHPLLETHTVLYGIASTASGSLSVYSFGEWNTGVARAGSFISNTLYFNLFLMKKLQTSENSTIFTDPKSAGSFCERKPISWESGNGLDSLIKPATQVRRLQLFYLVSSLMWGGVGTLRLIQPKLELFGWFTHYYSIKTNCTRKMRQDATVFQCIAMPQ